MWTDHCNSQRLTISEQSFETSNNFPLHLFGTFYMHQQNKTTSALAPQDTSKRINLSDRWKHHEERVAVLLRECPDFIVFLDKNFEVDWEDTDEHEAECHTSKVDIGKIQGTITCLEAIPVDHLPEPTKRSFRAILGEAMCVALDKDAKGAMALLANAEDFITARNHECARNWYVVGSAIAAMASFALAALVAAVYLWFRPDDGATAKFNIMAVGIGGATGALFSILLRVGRAPLDPAAGRQIHNLEGAARVCVGVIAALMVVCAIRSDLLMPQLSNPFGIVLACVVAGASERLATAIVERVEGASTHSPEKPTKYRIDKKESGQPQKG